MIVTISCAALIGSAALAMALAFGLGGRDVAGRMLSDAYDSGRRNKEDVKDDFRSGKEQVKQDAQKLQEDRQPAPVGGSAVRVQPNDGAGRFGGTR